MSEDYYEPEEYEEEGYIEDETGGQDGDGEEDQGYIDDYDSFVTIGEREEKEFTIIPKNQLEEEIRLQIQQVQDLCNLPEEYAALVLQYYNWDVEELQEKFFGDDQAVLRSGVLLKPVEFQKPNPEDLVECLICLEDVPFKYTYNLPCGHRYYCLDCWRLYLMTQYQERGHAMASDTRCIHPKCPVRIGKQGYKLLASSEVFEKFCYFMTKSYIDKNNQYAYCPNPTCGNAIKYSGYGSKPTKQVECSCKQKFCFFCSNEDHKPIDCELLKSWEQKNQSDDESQRLVRILAKPCPHCGRLIERNQGCNHMTCRGGCGKEWCWMCGQDWLSIHGSGGGLTGGYYSCNKYQESSRFQEDQLVEQFKADIERFQFHYQRFFDHGDKEKYAIKTKNDVEKKALQYREATCTNADFLLEAQNTLIEGRHNLKYTYIFGYFLPKTSPGRTLFEMQQTQLEVETERLADLIFVDIDKLDPPAIKRRIAVVRNFSQGLMEALTDLAEKEGLGRKKE